MSEDKKSYHERRAATQRTMADRCTDPAVASSHVALAELHEGRARGAGGRPVLRMVTSG